MAILALDWYIWVALGLLFLYALVRRVVRSRQVKRRGGGGGGKAPRHASWANRAGRAYGAKRP